MVVGCSEESTANAIETSTLKRQLAENEGAETAARIDKIGAALRRNPEYLQFDMQEKMPDIYKWAGSYGNLLITAPNPTLLLPPKAPVPPPRRAGASAAPDVAPATP